MAENEASHQGKITDFVGEGGAKGPYGKALCKQLKFYLVENWV